MGGIWEEYGNIWEEWGDVWEECEGAGEEWGVYGRSMGMSVRGFRGGGRRVYKSEDLKLMTES